MRVGRYLQGQRHEPSAPALMTGFRFWDCSLDGGVACHCAAFWHRRMAVVAAVWVAALVALEAWAGPASAAAAAWRAMVIDYLPFMALMLALYTAAGGILLRGGFVGTPAATPPLVAGMVLGLVMGTTGASMVLDTSPAARERTPAPQGAPCAVSHRPGCQCVGSADAPG